MAALAQAWAGAALQTKPHLASAQLNMRHVLRVDLWDDQRHTLCHTERAAVVHHLLQHGKQANMRCVRMLWWKNCTDTAEANKPIWNPSTHCYWLNGPV
jgi:hypothetical protein